MKSPSHRSLLAGFTLAVALIGGVTWLNMDREKRSQDAADWVAHTHKARFVIADLFSGLQEIESGMHGFVLTGMPAFLESYRAAASQIEDDVRLVRNLTSTIPEQQKSLDALEPLIKRCLELAEQVVKARQDQGFDEAQLLVAGQIAARGVRVEVTGDPVMLHGDRARLVEVFQNLLDNAVKFLSGQPDPRIQIGAEQEGGETVLFVRDNGKGIATGDLTKLFGLFNKLDEHVPGSGIGLAMVRRIVEAHGGKIEAYSDGPGKGTTFRFTLEKTFILPSSPKLCIL